MSGHCGYPRIGTAHCSDVVGPTDEYHPCKCMILWILVNYSRFTGLALWEFLDGWPKCWSGSDPILGYIPWKSIWGSISDGSYNHEEKATCTVLEPVHGQGNLGEIFSIGLWSESTMKLHPYRYTRNWSVPNAVISILQSMFTYLCLSRLSVLKLKWLASYPAEGLYPGHAWMYQPGPLLAHIEIVQHSVSVYQGLDGI